MIYVGYGIMSITIISNDFFRTYIIMHSVSNLPPLMQSISMAEAL